MTTAPNAADVPSEAENLARLFHETYERLAPSFGYETRKDSAKPWSEVPEKNKRLMVAVCGEILRQHTAAAVESATIVATDALKESLLELQSRFDRQRANYIALLNAVVGDGTIVPEYDPIEIATRHRKESEATRELREALKCARADLHEWNETHGTIRSTSEIIAKCDAALAARKAAP